MSKAKLVGMICKDSSSMGIPPMHIEDFKEAIHESVYDENDRYVGPGVISKNG